MYKYRLYLDGLPNCVQKRDPITGDVHYKYDEGVPVGKIVKDDKDGKIKYALYNHWLITVKTQPVEHSARLRIVGFEVEPRSYYPGETITEEYQKHRVLFLEDLRKESITFPFTY